MSLARVGVGFQFNAVAAGSIVHLQRHLARCGVGRAGLHHGFVRAAHNANGGFAKVIGQWNDQTGRFRVQFGIYYK